MPTTYAHWRFGDLGLKKLNDKCQNIIKNNRSIFDVGVHGPDAFFYYKAYKNNSVNKYGMKLHWTKYKDLLASMKEGYLKSCDRNAALSYILGFTAHFTLDSYCHSYIERKINYNEEINKPVSHLCIESQFDKYLLIKDGYDPIKKSVTFSLKPNKHNALVISELIHNFDYKTTYRAIKDQKFFLDLVKDNSDFKRNFIYKVLDIAKAPKYKDLTLGIKDVPETIDSNMRLDKLFNKALEVYANLVNDVIDFLNNDKELSPYFNNHFEYKENYKEIPIFSIEEEKKYEVTFQE